MKKVFLFLITLISLSFLSCNNNDELFRQNQELLNQIESLQKDLEENREKWTQILTLYKTLLKTQENQGQALGMLEDFMRQLLTKEYENSNDIKNILENIIDNINDIESGNGNSGSTIEELQAQIQELLNQINNTHQNCDGKFVDGVDIEIEDIDIEDDELQEVIEYSATVLQDTRVERTDLYVEIHELEKPWDLFSEGEIELTNGVIIEIEDIDDEDEWRHVEGSLYKIRISDYADIITKNRTIKHTISLKPEDNLDDQFIDVYVNIRSVTDQSEIFYFQSEDKRLHID